MVLQKPKAMKEKIRIFLEKQDPPREYFWGKLH